MKNFFHLEALHQSCNECENQQNAAFSLGTLLTAVSLAMTVFCAFHTWEALVEISSDFIDEFDDKL